MKLESKWLPWLAFFLALAGALAAGVTRMNNVENKAEACCQRLEIIDAKLDKLIYFQMERQGGQ